MQQVVVHIPSHVDKDKATNTVNEFGLSINEMHPGAGDPTLASYHLISAPDHETASKVADALNGQGFKAYLKPATFAP
jgi:hypothetical protein